MIKRVKEHFLTLPQKIELLLLYGAVMFALGVGLNYLLASDYPNYYDDDDEVTSGSEIKDFTDYDDGYGISFNEPAAEDRMVAPPRLKPVNDILLTELPAQLPAKGVLGFDAPEKEREADISRLVEELESPVDALAATVAPEPVERDDVVAEHAEIEKDDVKMEEVVEQDVSESKIYVHEHVIANGDTLSDVLLKAGIDHNEVYSIGKSVRKVFNIRSLKIGQKISITFDGSEFVKLQIFERTQIVNVVKLAAKKFDASIEEKILTVKYVYANGAVTSSLYRLGEKLGVPLKIMSDYIRYYSFDVDFQRDVKKGNKFAVMYEIYLDDAGKKVKNGHLIYGSLTLGSAELNIYRHSVVGNARDVDYYTDKGMTLRKSLMKTPINGAVISSPYGKRKHPILGYTKLHKGVDFAAPRGTPFYAAGDGVIEFIGRNGGYGNYIRIRHGAEYKTAYGHIQKFAKGMKKGRRVRQGQIIAYVGTTGRSTGPHLHYEILKNNKHINPMKVKIPARKHLAGMQLSKFNAARMIILQQLKSLQK